MKNVKLMNQLCLLIGGLIAIAAIITSNLIPVFGLRLLVAGVVFLCVFAAIYLVGKYYDGE